ncbi:hypothetical protein [Pseudomonas sp. WHRI 8519]|uniref:hypothetical protein n=1 Tax=Pseudomonas sp. WHRI 8519 TaxID=3162567 RepID=UPI0032ED52E2
MSRNEQRNVPTHVRDQARTLAQHEMGHYVVSKLMGFVTGDVNIEVHYKGHLGAATIHLAQPLRGVDAVSSYLERRVLVLYAGAMAETLPPSHIPKTGVDNEKAVAIIRGAQGAEQDHAKAREAIHLLRNILHPETHDRGEVQDQLDKLDEKLWKRAVELVEQFEKTIVGVAGALTQKLKVGDRRDTYLATLTESQLAEIPAIAQLPLLTP